MAKRTTAKRKAHKRETSKRATPKRTATKRGTPKSAAAKKITLAQAVDKIQKRTLTPAEAKRLFVVEPNPHQPFDFKSYINANAVDVRGFEPLARNASSVALAAAQRQTAPSTPRSIGALKIVAEGDSWFRLPSVYPDTCIDFLQAKYHPTNLAHWGDVLSDMLQKGEFWSYIDSGYDVLLFSGGGNDILGGGNLWEFLNLFDAQHGKPTDAPYYVKQAFFDNLDLVVANLKDALILPMRARAPHVKIVQHGYDYAIPQADGPWLGGPMMRQGLDPVFSGPLCRAIVRLMIDAYNDKLKMLQAQYPEQFVYLDLRGTIAKTEWFDELHGRSTAAKKIATKFGKAIDGLTISPEKKALVATRAARVAAAA